MIWHLCANRKNDKEWMEKFEGKKFILQWELIFHQKILKICNIFWDISKVVRWCVCWACTSLSKQKMDSEQAGCCWREWCDNILHTVKTHNMGCLRCQTLCFPTTWQHKRCHHLLSAWGHWPGVHYSSQQFLSFTSTFDPLHLWLMLGLT